VRARLRAEEQQVLRQAVGQRRLAACQAGVLQQHARRHALDIDPAAPAGGLASKKPAHSRQKLAPRPGAEPLASWR
jgi:hypothetical protein